MTSDSIYALEDGINALRHMVLEQGIEGSHRPRGKGGSQAPRTLKTYCHYDTCIE